jgi:hypothetical protein
MQRDECGEGFDRRGEDGCRMEETGGRQSGARAKTAFKPPFTPPA